MKKIKYIFIIIIFTLFIPRVYALSFDINTDVEVSVKEGTKKDLVVSIDNIIDTTEGIYVCTMNILFDKNIELYSPIRTLGSWTMTTGSIYLFDTGSPVFNDTDMFVIPVKVNGEGTIRLNNIVCTDSFVETEINNKVINFYIKEDVNNNQGNNSSSNKTDNSSNKKPNNSNNQESEKSNCNLSNIEFSEGFIEFDPNVLEYEVEINNFDSFNVVPKLEDSKSSYVIDKNVTENGGNVKITVNGSDGSYKTYTIYTKIVNKNSQEQKNENNNYIPIFIGIIVLLVLINLIRIIKNIIKNKEQK